MCTPVFITTYEISIPCSGAFTSKSDSRDADQRNCPCSVDPDIIDIEIVTDTDVLTLTIFSLREKKVALVCNQLKASHRKQYFGATKDTRSFKEIPRTAFHKQVGSQVADKSV